MKQALLTLAMISWAAHSLSAPAFATEIDNFTDRDTLTQDAMPVLDHEVNDILERAVRNANKDSPDFCSKSMLRQEIVRWTGPDPISVFELWTSLAGKVQTTNVPMSKSIYANATVFEAPAMVVFGIGSSFKLNGHIVGSDKLGHFFMQGLTYFKLVYNEGKTLEYVLQNEHAEDGIYGVAMTGVMSWADRATNYQGFRFWSQLYYGENPYVRCENGRKWVKRRDFTWADYVTAAWDEGMNCSEMKPGLAEQVQKTLISRGQRCPLDPSKCAEIRALDKSEFFTSPSCRTVGVSTLSQRLSIR